MLELMHTTQAGDPGHVMRKSISKQHPLNDTYTGDQSMVVEPAMVMKPSMVV